MAKPPAETPDDLVTTSHMRILTNLSADPAYAAAQKRVFETLTESELTKVSRQLWERGISREGREAIAGIILDTLVQENNTRPALSNVNVQQRARMNAQQQTRPVGLSDAVAIPVSESLRVFPSLPISTFTSPAGPDRVTGVVASARGIGDQVTATNTSINNLRPSARISQSDSIPDLEWTVWTPNEDGGEWRCISELPDSVNAGIHASFHQFCTSKPSQLIKYGQMARNPRLHLERGHCINKCVNFSSGSTDPTYAHANGDPTKACDTCINLRIICVRLVTVQDVVKLGVYPLPRHGQKRATWRETRFWVQKH